jgi:hypothetical protein
VSCKSGVAITTGMGTGNGVGVAECSGPGGPVGSGARVAIGVVVGGWVAGPVVGEASGITSTVAVAGTGFGVFKTSWGTAVGVDPAIDCWVGTVVGSSVVLVVDSSVGTGPNR